MQVFHTISELQKALLPYLSKSQSIGFVPTMGALHLGHLSLIEESTIDNQITVCSIFVNPIQFNNKTDLEKYPRTLEADLNLLKTTRCDFVFAPSVEEMYPVPSTDNYSFGILETVMEGAHRPGHFNGVGIVVKKLFEIVKPTNAYFGKKDFQQLAIINALVKTHQLPVNIIGCEIVREKDGLAMSSRNMLLSEAERAESVKISQSLFWAKQQADSLPKQEIIGAVLSRLTTNILQPEYFEIVDATTLQNTNNSHIVKGNVGCVAVKCGSIRLIDNIEF